MGEPASFLNDLSEAAVWRLEGTCSRFEEGWLAGRRPRVEDALAGTAGPERTALLGELLRLELHYRRAIGEAPQLAEYAGRFREAEGVPVELFAPTDTPGSGTHDFCARAATDATPTRTPGNSSSTGASAEAVAASERYRDGGLR